MVHFKSYVSDDRFLSFLGDSAVAQTARTLLEHAERHGLERSLQLLPPEAARALDSTPGLRVTASPDNDDYILSTAEWSALASKHYRNRRNVISRLRRESAPTVAPLDAGDPEAQRAMLDLFGRWATQRGIAGTSEAVNQALALQRVSSLPRPGDLLSLGVWIDGGLAAFSINEPLSRGYAMGHFWKTDQRWPGAYTFLLHETARALRAIGCDYLNVMQDLGVPGLRTAKSLCRPDHFLSKFDVRPIAVAPPPDPARVVLHMRAD